MLAQSVNKYLRHFDLRICHAQDAMPQCDSVCKPPNLVIRQCDDLTHKFDSGIAVVFNFALGPSSVHHSLTVLQPSYNDTMTSDTANSYVVWS
jgi:hypothetical protein